MGSQGQAACLLKRCEFLVAPEVKSEVYSYISVWCAALAASLSEQMGPCQGCRFCWKRIRALGPNPYVGVLPMDCHPVP